MGNLYLILIMSTSMLKPTPNNHSWGNFANTLVLVNSIAFLTCIVAQHNGLIDIFSPPFLADGFCISNKDKSLWYQSHALSFYSDTAFALLLWGISRASKGTISDEALEPINGAIMGIFGHGCGHMFLATKTVASEMDKTSWEGQTSPKGFAKSCLILGMFWIGFMRSIFGTKHMSKIVFFSAFYTAIHVFFIIGRFGFTYVQTMLLVT